MTSRRRQRLLVLRLLFLLVMFLVTGRLVQLQLVQHRSWFYRGFLNREKVQPRPVRRGAIRDRRGRVLVRDRGAHDVDLIYRGFRRGNPLGQAYHLYLQTLPDPEGLSPRDFRLTRERRRLQRRMWRLEGLAWRHLQEGRLGSARKHAEELERVTTTLAARRRDEDSLPDPRPAGVDLLWAASEAGRERLVRLIMELGAGDLPPLAGAPPPPHLRNRGVSPEDWAERARIIRGNIRFYLVRLLAAAWVLRGEGDPAFRRRWLEQDADPVGVIARRWRREITLARASPPSFAHWFGVRPEEVRRVLRRGRQALAPVAPGRRNPLAVLDRIHKHDTRSLLFHEDWNMWRLWDRGFRDKMRMIEDRRHPLWRHVDYETVKRIELAPRAHQGFFVVDSVRRVYTPARAGGWVPAVRLHGLVTGFTAEDAARLAGAELPRGRDRWWEGIEIPGLGPYNREYRETLMLRARRLGASIWRLGRSGLEWVLDRPLSGVEGYTVTEVDRRERLRARHLRRRRVPGRDVTLSLDLSLQEAMEEALSRATYGPGGRRVARAGAAVVACRTGEILVLAAAPLMDREEFMAGLRECIALRGEVEALPQGDARAQSAAERLERRRLDLADWSRLIPAKGMPGSAFKPVTALAGLASGLSLEHRCPGAWPTGWTTYECHCRRGGDLELALQESCNAFFGSLARALPEGRLQQTARELGFALRGPEGSLALPPFSPWAGEPGRTIRFHRPYLEVQARDAAVGIGYGVYTNPLALAALYASLATGRRCRLSILAGGGETGEPLPVPAAGLAAIRRGLRRVVGPEGTAASAALDRMGVCGKTGTALLRKGEGSRRNTWFAGFLPAAEPRLAFALLVPDAPPPCQGGNTAAPVIEAFLRDRRTAAWLAGRDG